MKVQLQHAYCLHSRNYRETSQILEILTMDHGLISCIHRGARKKNNTNQYLFSPLLVSWSGRGDLFTLTNIETLRSKHITSAECSILGMYLSELVIKLVPKSSPSNELYNLYEEIISSLEKNAQRQKLLRMFELKLLELIGHGLSLDKEMDHETNIENDEYYRYEVGLGPKRVAYSGSGWNVIKGSTLLALKKPLEMESHCLEEAKKLMRGILNWHLANKPLHSREILQYMHS